MVLVLAGWSLWRMVKGLRAGDWRSLLDEVSRAERLPALLLSDPEAFSPMIAQPGPLTLGPLKIRLAQVEHGECWATRIDDALCYTGDAGPRAAVDELARGCRVLLADVSRLDDDRPSGGHLSGRQKSYSPAGHEPNFSSSRTYALGRPPAAPRGDPCRRNLPGNPRPPGAARRPLTSQKPGSYANRLILSANTAA